MAPTFTIFQDPPCVDARTVPVSSSKTFTTPLGPSRPPLRSSSGSTSLSALDADKENIDPVTGLPRTTSNKPKAKKSFGSKNKDGSSKSLTKASKASRGSPASGPAKSGKPARTSPYPDPVMPLPTSELTLGLFNLSEPLAPCLITGFRASALSDFGEPDFDLRSDFVQQPSPTRPNPVTTSSSLWPVSHSPCMPESESDKKARELTELPLADLSEAFTAVPSFAKKSTCQSTISPSNGSLPSLLNEKMPCLPPVFQTIPRFELQNALIANLDSGARPL